MKQKVETRKRTKREHEVVKKQCKQQKKQHDERKKQCEEIRRKRKGKPRQGAQEVELANSNPIAGLDVFQKHGSQDQPRNERAIITELDTVVNTNKCCVCFKTYEEDVMEKMAMNGSSVVVAGGYTRIVPSLSHWCQLSSGLFVCYCIEYSLF